LSTDFDWDSRVKAEDANAGELARRRFLERRATLGVARLEERLDAARMMRNLAVDGLTVEESVVGDDGQPLMNIGPEGVPTAVVRRRPARFRELPKGDIYAVLALFNAAAAAERADLGKVDEALRAVRQEEDEEIPIQILGPEALAFMVEKISLLVATLNERAAERRAAGELPILDPE
jgi:hypothetical protein